VPQKSASLGWRLRFSNYSANLSAAPATWPVLLTTNSPGNKVHISDPRSATNKSLFYRARNGT